MTWHGHNQGQKFKGEGTLGPNVLDVRGWNGEGGRSLLHCGYDIPRDRMPSYWLPLQTSCAMELFTRPLPRAAPPQRACGKHSPGGGTALPRQQWSRPQAPGSLSSLSRKVGLWCSSPLSEGQRGDLSRKSCNPVHVCPPPMCVTSPSPALRGRGSPYSGKPGLPKPAARSCPWC